MVRRLSAGGSLMNGLTQMHRQSDANFFKKYSQMKLQMKRHWRSWIVSPASGRPILLQSRPASRFCYCFYYGSAEKRAEAEGIDNKHCKIKKSA
jgi:hypothetical protein